MGNLSVDDLGTMSAMINSTTAMVSSEVRPSVHFSPRSWLLVVGENRPAQLV
jgi:hypothetical protein